MERLLRGLLLDLNRRCVALREVLASRTHHPNLSSYLATVNGFLDMLERSINSLLSDPDLGVQQLLVNQFQDYKRLAEAVFIAEAYPIPLIERYSDVDHRWLIFSRRLAGEVGYPHEPPVVFAGSREYYWTYSPFSLIAIPACEHASLLGLPDFFHEIGHNLLFHDALQGKGAFTQKFLEELERYVAAGKRRMEDERRPTRYKELFDWIREAWRDRWLEEFAADMIAAYLAGPSYAWQHFRLCAKSRDIFRPGPHEVERHPSDESRMRAITCVLEGLGLGETVAAVQTRWGQYLPLAGEQVPHDYHLCYPDELLAALAQGVTAACNALGLRAYSDQPTDAPTIAHILNEAWKRFLADPDSYHSWEAAQLEAIGLRPSIPHSGGP